MTCVVDIKLYFAMTDEQLLYWANNGDKDEVYAASSEYRFRQMYGLLESQKGQPA